MSENEPLYDMARLRELVLIHWLESRQRRRVEQPKTKEQEKFGK